MPASPNESFARASSSSLIERAKAKDETAWARLVALCTPLVYSTCRAMNVPADDCPDVVQEVFRKVAANLDRFRNDRAGDSFRGWLLTVSKNAIRDFFRSEAARPTAVGGSDVQRAVNAIPDEYSKTTTLDNQHDSNVFIVQRAVDDVRIEFESRTWQAFWKTAVEGKAAVDVAGELGVSKWAVYQAKSRVLRRLRQDLAGLLE